MNICILHIGFANPAVTSKHQPSPVRFQNLLGPFMPETRWQVINCVEDALPTDTSLFDGYLITGGKYSVFEDLPWQYQLFDFIRSVHANKVPLAGICYGHQAIAHALGGEVERFIGGWGVGINQLQTTQLPKWMQPQPAQLDLLAMHQDQVTQLPPHCDVFLSSDFCPISGFYQAHRLFAIQQHPEFTPELCQDLIERRQDRIGSIYQQSIDSLNTPHQGAVVGQWIAQFFVFGS
ncbi:MAG: amidotransferase [Oceanospirillaceae bacterium]|jgi:GMP synthase-like glutamine amidotransferase|nr:amidotransferase [Oceanospirillaceae bacterium]